MSGTRSKSCDTSLGGAALGENLSDYEYFTRCENGDRAYATIVVRIDFVSAERARLEAGDWRRYYFNDSAVVFHELYHAAQLTAVFGNHPYRFPGFPAPMHFPDAYQHFGIIPARQMLAAAMASVGADGHAGLNAFVETYLGQLAEVFADEF